MRLKNRVHPKLVLTWIGAMFDHPELYILRHGETVWNRQGRYQGRKDSPLTEKGRQQAVSQRKLLNAIETLPRKVYVSPLGRTVETARLAVTFVDHPIVDDRLQELNFGKWEGATKQQISKQTDCSFKDGSWHFNSPGGETFAMISARALEFLNDLDEPAVLVTHGMTSRVLRGLCLGLCQADMLKLPIGQGCIYHFFNGTERVLR